MNDWTIISYPSPRDNLLLSLTESRSRYMLPFGGRFRVIDFLIRNAHVSESKSTVIYNNVEDDLENYIDSYINSNGAYSPISVITSEFSNINFCKNLVHDIDSKYFIIYNGDFPSIIDFSDIMKTYMSKKTDTLLFKMVINGRPSMAYKLLVTSRKTLLKTIGKIIKEKRSSSNIFEMIINTMINAGIRKTAFHAHYWPISNVPEYYALSRNILWDRELFNLIYSDNSMKSQIVADRYAYIGEKGRIVNSFISDYCSINGRVENSIIYPGVEIGLDSDIRDSIILPFVRIGEGVKINKAVIDETTDFNDENSMINIGNSSRIGSDDLNIKSSDFPRSLFSSITVIGKNCRVPDNVRIGGGCYIASGLGEVYFREKKYLHDGLSIVK